MLSYIIVGSGYRAEYFGRIARAYPDQFRALFLCRSTEKATLMKQHTGIDATVSREACLAFRPDFAVIAVDRSHVADAAESALKSAQAAAQRAAQAAASVPVPEVPAETEEKCVQYEVQKDEPVAEPQEIAEDPTEVPPETEPEVTPEEEPDTAPEAEADASLEETEQDPSVDVIETAPEEEKSLDIPAGD